MTRTMNTILKASFVAAAALCFTTLSAQNERPSGILSSTLHGLEYEVYAGVNIGGSSPLPLPAEIRQIKSYSPNLNPIIGTTITKWFDKGDAASWGVSVGLKLETKSMTTRASVKNYGMEIINGGSLVSGNWTGNVFTKYHSSQLTFPITGVYRFSNRWKVNAGVYLSYAFSNTFDGEVYDGYLREGSPTGPKVTFEDGAKATYNFSSNLRHFQWGAQAGATWKALKHLNVNANLAWGLNGIFESSFKTITFSMYSIYLNLGFGYIF